MSDLSCGLERKPIPVITDLEVSAVKLTSLSNWTYITQNRLTLREHEMSIPDLDSSVTILEAMGHVPAAVRAGEEEDTVEVPAVTRRQLKGGVGVELVVKLTQRMGFGVFASNFISKGM
jgi:hypothetical protein